MKVAGLLKTSLIDYPDKIVSIIFTQGCNFRCPYCHNPALLPAESVEREYLTLPVLLDFLQKRKGLIDGLSITGGEPTLQPDLKDWIIAVKELGLLVKLDSNGSRPEIISDLIKQQLLDYLALDLKLPLNLYRLLTDHTDIATKIKKSINLVKASGIEYEFRTTVVPGLHGQAEMMEIGKLLNGAKRFYLQNFKPNNTYQPAYLSKVPFTVAELEQFKNIIKPMVNEIKIRY